MEDYKKKYEDLIASLKKAKDDEMVRDDRFCVVIDNIVSELAESEDEKIRKEIVEYIKIQQRVIKDEGHIQQANDIEKWLVWLEKQGEQKTEVKYVYPKFRVGDVIVPINPNGYYVPERVQFISNGYYNCKSDDNKSFLSIPICSENEYKLVKQNPTWSEEDEDRLSDAIFFVREYQILTRDKRLLNAAKETEDWLKSIKDSVKSQSKQGWSDEDEKMCNNLIATLTKIGATSRTDSTSVNYTFPKEINWLKSLKPQPHWKPSDEMLEALYRVTPENVMEKSEDEMLLDQLYQGLKYGKILSK